MIQPERPVPLVIVLSGWPLHLVQAWIAGISGNESVVYVRPINNNPYLFRTGRVPLVVQDVLLVALAG